MEIPYLVNVSIAVASGIEADDGTSNNAEGKSDGKNKKSEAAKDPLRELTRLPTEVELSGKDKTTTKSQELNDDAQHMDVLRASFKHLFR